MPKQRLYQSVYGYFTEEYQYLIEELNFGKKMARQVAWESWSFRVVDLRQVEITNESCGYMKVEYR